MSRMIRITADGAHVREDRIKAVYPRYGEGPPSEREVVGCRVHLVDGDSVSSTLTAEEVVRRMADEGVPPRAPPARSR